LTSQSQANEIANKLTGLTIFEKRIARNRLKKFYDGRLPQWTKQVEKTGPNSLGYVLVAFVWGTFAGVLDIVVCALALVNEKSSSPLAVEIPLFLFSLLLFAISLTRWMQGRRIGKEFKSSRLS